ncbi:unnamed protein product [Diatraea saccharalis]|uniref:Uncharacterized protein n=1 Tax=Diatraea saccharalis TaxID=40085 RepID=A0A9N9MZZ7_9NEOP|nr:unnamed protein product [Diatraea saccharalis]
MEDVKGFDNITKSTMYLLPEWLSQLTEDKDESNNDEELLVKLLENDGRRAIWNMCSTLGVDSNGVPGEACRLVERYLAVQMRNFLSMPTGSGEWEAFKRSLTSRLPLTMISCIQLASKMNGATFHVKAKVVRACLLCKGITFSIVDIVQSEFNVFRVLGYRLSLWTSVEIGEALALDVGMPQEMLEGVALFINISEYRRDRLLKRVRWAANLTSRSEGFNRTILRTLHLAAACVAAAARYLNFKGPDPLPQLAKLTRAPVCYLRGICDIILASTLNDDIINSTSPRKRKRDS